MDQSAIRPLKVGVFLPFAAYMMDRQTPRWSDLVIMAQRAEALGFDSLWLADHLLLRLLPSNHYRPGQHRCAGASPDRRPGWRWYHRHHARAARACCQRMPPDPLL